VCESEGHTEPVVNTLVWSINEASLRACGEKASVNYRAEKQCRWPWYNEFHLVERDVPYIRKKSKSSFDARFIYAIEN